MKFANCTTPDHHRKLLQWQSQLHYECKTLSSLLQMLGSRRLRSWEVAKLRKLGNCPWVKALLFGPSYGVCQSRCAGKKKKLVVAVLSGPSSRQARPTRQLYSIWRTTRTMTVTTTSALVPDPDPDSDSVHVPTPGPAPVPFWPMSRSCQPVKQVSQQVLLYCTLCRSGHRTGHGTRLWTFLPAPQSSVLSA